MAPGLVVRPASAREAPRVAATANRVEVAGPAPEVVRSLTAEWARLLLAVLVSVVVPLLAVALAAR